MKILGENLRIGDVMLMWNRKPAMIVAFQEYKGTLDFVCKIAVFADGTRQSITYGHYYECISRA